MVNVANLKEKLKATFTDKFKGEWTGGYFVSKDDKEEVWSYFLDDEAQYVNGGIYVHRTPTPLYHKQSFKNIYFEVNEDNTVTFNVFINGDSFIQDQIDSIRTYVDGEVIVFTRALFENDDGRGVTLKVPITTNGELILVVPPFNLLEDNYQGISTSWNCKSQNLSITNATKQNGKLSVVCKITNPCKNQSLKLTTFFRNGNSHYTETIELANTNTSQSIEVDCGSSDVKYMLELISYKSPTSKDYYLGKSITKTL